MSCETNFAQVIPVQVDCAVPITPGQWRADQPLSFAVRVDYRCPPGEPPPIDGCADAGADPAAWTADIVTIDRITGRVDGGFAVAGECAGLKVLQLDHAVPAGVYKVGGPQGTFEIEVVDEALATGPLDLACAGGPVVGDAPRAPAPVTGKRGCGCDAGAPAGGILLVVALALAAARGRRRV